MSNKHRNGDLLRGKSNLRVLGDIVIDDNINRWNVKSSTCHISTDKNIAFSSLELIQGSKSLRLSKEPNKNSVATLTKHRQRKKE